MNPFQITEYPVTIGGRVFSLVFDLNTIAAVEDEFGDIQGVAEAMEKAGPMRRLLTILLNCAVDRQNELTGGTSEHVTDQWTGKNIQYSDRLNVAEIVGKAFAASLPEPREDTDPNPETGQIHTSW